MDGVGISIIERPRPLHNHDTPNPTHHTYTLKCEEPVLNTFLERPETISKSREGPLRSRMGVTSKMTVTYLSP